MQFLRRYTFESLFVILFLAIATALNLQFIDGSNTDHYIAGHDEYIAVKEVYSILQPLSAKHFIMAVISGDALYYGRIMFYADAIAAFIPYKIWGISGMVYAIRMTHALLLYAGLLILAFTFLNKQLYRFLFLMAGASVYYSMYFVMMPKPEPYQLFFLALFLNRFKKSDWQFGRHFIWLGIAYGLKFNVLIILPFVFVLPFYKNQSISIRSVKSSLFSFLYFIGGIIIAIPCLILTPIKPIFLKTYLHETFEGTGKVYDDADLKFSDWILDGLGGNYQGVKILAILFLVFAVLLLMDNMRTLGKTKRVSAPFMLISGLALMLVIMLKTKRLWPHYLWTGYELTLLGMFITAEHEGQKWKKYSERIVLLLLISFSIGVFSYRDLPDLLALDSKPDIVETDSLSRKAIAYMDAKYTGKRIGTDGTILYPFRDFVQVDRYNPFSSKPEEPSGTRYYWYRDKPENIWENDVVVLYRFADRHTEFVKPASDMGQTIYESSNGNRFMQDTTIGKISIYSRY